MPVYEYACKACGQHLEVAQSFKDAPLTTCPACEGPLRKVFGSIGISFKGTGFYRTDSRLPAKRETAEKAEAKTGTDSSSGDGAAAKSTDGSSKKPADTSTGKSTGKADAKTA